jgi:hypothetical protein
MNVEHEVIAIFEDVLRYQARARVLKSVLRYLTKEWAFEIGQRVQKPPPLVARRCRRSTAGGLLLSRVRASFAGRSQR